MTFLYRIPGFRKIILVIENMFFNLFYKSILGNKIKIFGLPLIFIKNRDNVKFGRNITLISNSYFSEPGVSHPVVIRQINKNAILSIGDNVGMSGGCICVKTEVIIGNDVLLGANVSITDTDFHAIDPTKRRINDQAISKKVTIGNNVFIGMNSIILKGVTIGENSVIGAGSIVSKDVPANQIWAGSPAKFIKDIS